LSECLTLIAEIKEFKKCIQGTKSERKRKDLRPWVVDESVYLDMISGLHAKRVFELPSSLEMVSGGWP